MESVHRTRCMMMEGMRMVSMRMMRCAQNMGSFGLRLIGNERNQDLRNGRVSQVFFHGIGPERLDPADQCVYVYKGKGRPHDRIKAFGQDL